MFGSNDKWGKGKMLTSFFNKKKKNANFLIIGISYRYKLLILVIGICWWQNPTTKLTWLLEKWLPIKPSKDNSLMWCLPQTPRCLSQYFAQRSGQVVFREDLNLPFGHWHVLYITSPHRFSLSLSEEICFLFPTLRSNARGYGSTVVDIQTSGPI